MTAKKVCLSLGREEKVEICFFYNQQQKDAEKHKKNARRVNKNLAFSCKQQESQFSTCCAFEAIFGNQSLGLG